MRVIYEVKVGSAISINIFNMKIVYSRTQMYKWG